MKQADAAKLSEPDVCHSMRVYMWSYPSQADSDATVCSVFSLPFFNILAAFPLPTPSKKIRKVVERLRPMSEILAIRGKTFNRLF